jgi:hypothetical protein
LKVPPGINENSVGTIHLSTAVIRKRICWEKFPGQSVPAFQVMTFDVPTATFGPMSPVTDAAGTVQVVPPSLEICRLTVTDWKPGAVTS